MGSRTTLLEEHIDYHFKDRALLEEALTHASFRNESSDEVRDYERLEFLGDAVVELVVSDMLFQRFPMLREGGLTQMRARLVNAKTLAQLADDLKLGELARVGVGEERSGGRNRTSILSNLFEALIAAVFLDSGYSDAHRVVAALIEPQIVALLAEPTTKDAKSSLQEWAQDRLSVTPTYSIVDTIGPQHEAQFIAAVHVQGLGTIQGTGGSKKAAEQAAAAEAMVLGRAADAAAACDDAQAPVTAEGPQS